jgi:hypothetical protein
VDFIRSNLSYGRSNNLSACGEGSGSQRDLVISADGATEQIRVKTDGSVLIPGLVSAFTDNTDTPPNYAGEAGKVATVNGAEDGLEFGDPPSTNNVIDSDYNEGLITTTGTFRTLTIPANTLSVGMTIEILAYMETTSTVLVIDPSLIINFNGSAAPRQLYNSLARGIDNNQPFLISCYISIVEPTLEWAGITTIDGSGTSGEYLFPGVITAQHDPSIDTTVTFDLTTTGDGLQFHWATIRLLS